MNSIYLNGKILPADEPALLATNRGYRYGDGLFETMKVMEGKILLAAYHFERLFAGLELLKFEIPKLLTREKLEAAIQSLCRKNKCEQLARVRLSFSRGNGGLYDDDRKLQYLVECWPLNESMNRLNENGLMIDIYPDAEKGTDKFSNLKSANFLPYSMAALFAKENKLNDCLVLNTMGHIADSTIANLFLIKNGVLMTPGLAQGCVAGVMRRYLIGTLQQAGLKVQEMAISAQDLKNADEIFLTNAISGIRWVKQFGEKSFTNEKTGDIYNRFVKTIFT
ncbi:MAG: aminotransferase class IV [Bacteroidota bacterium]|nr:aminotransferase class IV [Bacteroidota bacterium]